MSLVEAFSGKVSTLECSTISPTGDFLLVLQSPHHLLCNQELSSSYIDLWYFPWHGPYSAQHQPRQISLWCLFKHIMIQMRNATLAHFWLMEKTGTLKQLNGGFEFSVKCWAVLNIAFLAVLKEAYEKAILLVFYVINFTLLLHLRNMQSSISWVFTL